MSADFPKSEAELVQRRPGSNQPGVFPRKWLLRDERVLYETRPIIWSLYWGRICVFVALFLLFLVDATYPQYASSAGYWGFEAFLLVAPLSIIYLAWRGHAYAITNNRVLAAEGMISSNVEYATYEQVESLTAAQGGVADIRFDLAPSTGTHLIGAGKPKRIRWRSVPNAAAAYNFVQDAFRIRTWVNAQTAQFDAFVQASLEGRIACAYCGGLIDLKSLNPAAPKCPQCGAPVRIGNSGA